MNSTLKSTVFITGLLLVSGAALGQHDARRYTESDMREAYDLGYKEGQADARHETRGTSRKGYQHFTFGLYGGVNSTRFEGEDVNGDKLTGRLGYQLGFFFRGGGRVFGQLGAEYLTSSSNFFQAGDGATIKDIKASLNQQYIHLPAYVGVKLVQSRRGISAVRLQLGAEYAFPVGVNTNEFNLKQSDFNSATVNGLVGLGFDLGPLMIGAVYHHGFLDVLKDSNVSKRRILGVNVGVKF
jgi:hypothetical protein